MQGPFGHRSGASATFGGALLGSDLLPPRQPPSWPKAPAPLPLLEALCAQPQCSQALGQLPPQHRPHSTGKYVPANRAWGGGRGGRLPRVRPSGTAPGALPSKALQSRSLDQASERSSHDPPLCPGTPLPMHAQLGLWLPRGHLHPSGVSVSGRSKLWGQGVHTQRPASSEGRVTGELSCPSGLPVHWNQLAQVAPSRLPLSTAPSSLSPPTPQELPRPSFQVT